MASQNQESLESERIALLHEKILSVRGCPLVAIVHEAAAIGDKD